MTIEYIGSERNIIGGYKYNVTCHSCIRSETLERGRLENPPRYLETGVSFGAAKSAAEEHDNEFEGVHRIMVSKIARGGIKEFRVNL